MLTATPTRTFRDGRWHPGGGAPVVALDRSAGDRKPLTGGHWVTINGHPVYIKGTAGHVPARVKHAHGTRFTRAEIERGLLDHHKATGETWGPEHDKELADTNPGGDAWAFKGKLPTEIKEHMAGRPELRRLFKVTHDRGGGADAFGALGDRYLDLAELAAGSPLRAAKRTAHDSNDPEVKFLAHVHDNLSTGKDRAEMVKLNPGGLRVGDSFKVNGQSFRVAEDEHGYRVLKAGRDYSVELDALSAVPADKGSFRPGRATAKAKTPMVPDDGIPFSRSYDPARGVWLSHGWDESKHPRATDGRFGEKAGEHDGKGGRFVVRPHPGDRHAVVDSHTNEVAEHFPRKEDAEARAKENNDYLATKAAKPKAAAEPDGDPPADKELDDKIIAAAPAHIDAELGHLKAGGKTLAKELPKAYRQARKDVRASQEWKDYKRLDRLTNAAIEAAGGFDDRAVVDRVTAEQAAKFPADKLAAIEKRFGKGTWEIPDDMEAAADGAAARSAVDAVVGRMNADQKAYWSHYRFEDIEDALVYDGGRAKGHHEAIQKHIDDSRDDAKSTGVAQAIYAHAGEDSGYVDAHHERLTPKALRAHRQAKRTATVALCRGDVACAPCAAKEREAEEPDDDGGHEDGDEPYEPDAEQLPPEFRPDGEPGGRRYDAAAGKWSTVALDRSNCGTGAGGFRSGNTCATGGYGRENGIKTSRVTKANITAAGAKHARTFTDKSGRTVAEHKTDDGRLFHVVTHKTGRKTVHQIHPHPTSKAGKAAAAKAMPGVKGAEPEKAPPAVDPETPRVPQVTPETPRPHSAPKMSDPRAIEEPAAEPKSGMGTGLFGQGVIDSSGVGKQAGLFHEANEAKPAAAERVGSKSANDPANTGKLFDAAPAANKLGEPVSPFVAGLKKLQDEAAAKRAAKAQPTGLAPGETPRQAAERHAADIQRADPTKSYREAYVEGNRRVAAGMFGAKGVTLPSRDREDAPRSDAERDTAVVNVPLHKRGNIDAQIDRYKAQQANEKRATEKAASAAARSDKEVARELFDKHADVIAKRTAEKHGVSAAGAKKELDQMVKWRPTLARKLLEKHEADEAAKAAPAQPAPARWAAHLKGVHDDDLHKIANGTHGYYGDSSRTVPADAQRAAKAELAARRAGTSAEPPRNTYHVRGSDPTDAGNGYPLEVVHPVRSSENRAGRASKSHETTPARDEAHAAEIIAKLKQRDAIKLKNPTKKHSQAGYWADKRRRDAEFEKFKVDNGIPFSRSYDAAAGRWVVTAPAATPDVVSFSISGPVNESPTLGRDAGTDDTPIRYFWKRLIGPGTIHHPDPRYGQRGRINLSPADIQTMYRSTKAWMKETGGMPYVPLKHVNTTEAKQLAMSRDGELKHNLGWITELRVDADGWISGLHKMIGHDAILHAQRNESSVSYEPNFKSGRTGKVYPLVIRHNALVYDPVLEGLGQFEPLAA